ncbi:SRPBCC family protein [Leeuwenhoekiella marinoflava]|uniref:SRPBCC family protein n=1 Tax=Leeuwenhoekiella marinoflava TaxID=988 RepID=UPI0030024D69
MQYTKKIIIDLPLEKTVEFMDSLENLKKWQEGLVEAKVIRGNFGEKGAKTELKYDFGKRKMTLIETILETDMPRLLIAEYTTKNVYNIQRNTFEATQDGKTIWTSESEFKFEGLAMKTFGFLIPGAFKKQSLKYMRDFKNFAENQ